MIFSFWISIFLIFYAYLGYPLTLWVLSQSFFKGNKKDYKQRPIYQPKVSLLISAYNEEGVIENKINNSLELDYPGELLEIVVISDGSNDKTNVIVERFRESGVLLRDYHGRIGKTACLNKAVPLANGEIIVFSDANSLYDKNAIKHLVKHFSDGGIGFVTGYTKYSKAADTEVIKPIGIYSKIEKITKILESRIGSCVGADGAIFAIRKSLFQPLNDFDINDFVIPLNIVKRGYRGIIDENAFCVENTAKDSTSEFNRQARITNRTIRALFNNVEMFNPAKFGMFSIKLILHKLFKYLVPIFLILLFISNLFLITDGIFYAIFFGIQLTLYLLSCVEYKGRYYNIFSKLIGFARTFFRVNAAILLGWIQYIRGKTYTTWSTSR